MQELTIEKEMLDASVLKFKILNVCLIPDAATPEGAEFLKNITRLSKELNTIKPSIYELATELASDDERLSLPHCTIMHIKVPADPVVIDAVIEKLNTIIGQTLTLSINGLKTLSACYFMREELENNSEDYLRPSTIQWVSVEKAADLLKLQQAIVTAIESIQNVSPITKIDAYRPHFTLAVSKKPEIDLFVTEQQTNLLGRYKKGLFFSVPCMAVIGDSGPVGQVREVKKYKL